MEVREVLEVLVGWAWLTFEGQMKEASGKVESPAHHYLGTVMAAQSNLWVWMWGLWRMVSK